MSGTERQLQPPAQYYNALAGKMEPWARCVYCNTHVLNRRGESQPRCDCRRTFLNSKHEVCVVTANV